MRPIAVVVTSVALLAGTAHAIYKPKEYISRYCSASGDLCLGIFDAGGIVFQIATMERYFARYALCVRPPRGTAKCFTAPIRRQGSVYGSHVRWPRRFGDHGLGVYRVTWKHRGRPVGPTLRFRRR